MANVGIIYINNTYKIIQTSITVEVTINLYFLHSSDQKLNISYEMHIKSKNKSSNNTYCFIEECLAISFLSNCLLAHFDFNEFSELGKFSIFFKICFSVSDAVSVEDVERSNNAIFRYFDFDRVIGDDMFVISCSSLSEVVVVDDVDIADKFPLK